MRIIEKFECEYCDKEFSDKSRCRRHENRHKKIEKFLKTHVDGDRSNISLDLDKIVRSNKFTLSKDYIFQNNEINKKHTFIYYEELIKLYSHVHQHAEYDVKFLYNIAGDLYAKNSIVVYMYMVPSLSDGTFKNAKVSNGRICFQRSLTDLVSDEDYKKLLKFKLSGKSFRFMNVTNGIIRFSKSTNTNDDTFECEMKCL